MMTTTLLLLATAYTSVVAPEMVAATHSMMPGFIPVIGAIATLVSLLRS